MTRFPRLAAAAWTLLILLACSIPGTDLPSVDIDFIDKLAHFALFAGYGWLWMSALKYPHGRRTTVVVASGLFLAVGTEIYQGWLPWERTPDPLDALSNAIGLLCAVVTFVLAGGQVGNLGDG